MKKWTIILMASLLMLSACQSDESHKGEATTKTKVEQEKSNKEENISKESAKKIEQTVNNAVKVSAFGWDIVNKKEAYVQFLVKKNGKWEEGYVKTIEESDQFEPKEVKVVSIDDEKSLVTILYKDTARYFLQPDEVSIAELEQFTEKGNSYQHSITTQVENGHQVGIYICQKELEESWQNRIGSSVWEVDQNGNVYFYTLCRYLTSKNLRKDAKSFETLTNEDIDAIKKGFTNYRFLSNSNPIKRVYEIFWEIYHYSNGGNPNGHSVTQRAEFVSCAWKAMKNNPLIGAGCNIKSEMDMFYAQSVNQLSKEHKCFPHNEYMFIGVLCGFAGLLLFVIALIGLIASSKNIWTPLTIAWFVIVIVSFFTEDTLDTAAGQSLFGLFGAVILFCQPRKIEEK